MFLDNIERQGEPKAGAFTYRFGGEKGFKNSVQVFLSNTFAVIYYFDNRLVTTALGPNDDLSEIVDGVGSVYQQVHDHLIDLGACTSVRC